MDFVEYIDEIEGILDKIQPVSNILALNQFNNFFLQSFPKEKDIFLLWC